MRLDYLDGLGLKKAMVSGASWLGENKQAVDSLNVFPVPDGDTGTNMYLTLAAAAREAEKVPGDSISQVAEAVSLGALMGARGNSGVISSQLLRGFAKGVEGKTKVDPSGLARAFQEAVNMAYKAVMKPVEGTILTVARMAARRAQQAAREGKDIIGVIEEAIAEAERTLARTPEMLHTLKEAGVVDAGGKGLVLFLQGALAGLTHGELKADRAPQVSREVAAEVAIPAKAEDQPSEVSGPLKYRYCTEFILKGKNLNHDKIKEDIMRYGDSMLVVGTSEVTKVHIHTNNPGVILEYCLMLGTLHDIKIDNMEEQHRETIRGEPTKGETASSGRVADVVPINRGRTQPVERAIVAVAVGEGLEEIMKSLGATYVVAGGQTMNPSIEDLVKAAEATGAKEIIFLPNNSNVILTAKQASSLIKAQSVAVIPTKTVPQGIAALLAHRPDADFATNEKAMTEAAKSVRTGEVTYAVRKSTFNGLSVEEKDAIGLIDGQLRVAGKKVDEVVRNLIGEMVTDDDELITIYYGADVELRDAKRVAEQVAEDHPHCEVDLQYGGQPLYYYIISVE